MASGDLGRLRLGSRQAQLVTLACTMDAAQTIRQAVARVAEIRVEAASDPQLQGALTSVKAFQAKRFAGTYADLLASAEYGSAARFFLNDLYSDRDYSQRDAQFSRIAGALQKFFPHQVVATAVFLAQLHVLTEELDLQMAQKWLRLGATELAQNPIARYVTSWRQVGRSSDRSRQLEMVLSVGRDLDRLTRTTGLRLMLRMMRGPAHAAGLGSLQAFLEMGFDTFAGMSGKGSRAREFLEIIHEREEMWIELLSTGDIERAQDDLSVCLARLQEYR